MVIVGPAIAAASAIAAKGYYDYASENAKDYKNANTSRDNYYAALQRAGLQDLNTDDVIDDLYKQGILDANEYSKAIKAYDKLGNLNSKENLWAVLTSKVGGSNSKEINQLYKTLTDNIPNLSYNNFKNGNLTVDDIKSGIYSAVPKIAGISAPQYYDTDFEGYQRDVTDTKWWTGQELADLHNIDYDVNNYYDAIKQGADAAVAYQDFTNQQAKAMLSTQDTINNVAYLDALRANKEQSIIKGATLGAQMANDLLANQTAYNNFATNQADYVNTSAEAMSTPLQNQAKASLTARQYFDNLAKTLGQDVETLYWNDVNRYGADINANANFYSADQELRGNLAQANAAMNSAYNQANATVNLARAQANQQANEYAWYLDRAVEANNGNTVAGLRDYYQYLNNKFSGQDNVTGILKNTSK